MPLHLLAIAAGGALGALLRYLLTALGTRLWGAAFPWGTLTVNVLGCFLIGVAWALLDGRPDATTTRAFVITGLLGAFTTFSTYGLEGIMLFRSGLVTDAVLYLLASNAVGLLAVGLGLYVAHLFRG